MSGVMTYGDDGAKTIWRQGPLGCLRIVLRTLNQLDSLVLPVAPAEHAASRPDVNICGIAGLQHRCAHFKSRGLPRELSALLLSFLRWLYAGDIPSVGEVMRPLSKAADSAFINSVVLEAEAALKDSHTCKDKFQSDCIAVSSQALHGKSSRRLFR